MKQTCEH